MGDGDGGDAIDYSAAEIPVEFGTEVVVSAAGGGDDTFEELIVIPADVGGDSGRLPSEEEDLVELTWVEPDTHSGP
ncbi:hypothetical protein O1R50_07870 [Glycomyces luteolus]|uniref:Uncharacterized protein n=1 Tax=Glycomyces luteolus TaxID=2670330 RepID=A0A9X3SR31_9ACTN|nr:hypothetical protein [Glycomyces luteolus]MDA1359534.1 hypothetical protein [Glycomyces luteolus]